DNLCLPTYGYDYTIFPHWSAMRTDQPGGGIFTTITGVAPNRVFIIEWRAATAGGNVNFEVLLYESSVLQQFDVIYGQVAGGGVNATVGVEGYGPSTQWSCDTSQLTPGLRLRFTQPYCGTPTPTVTGTPPTRTRTPTRTPTRTATPSNT